MRSRILGIFSAGTVLVLAGCALQARTDYDSKFSLTSCHSYAFADPRSDRLVAASAFDNPLNAKRLREAIAASLAARSLAVATDDAGADCLLSYAIGSRLAPDVTAMRYGWGVAAGPPVGWGYYGVAGGVAWSAPYDYREGRVTVNLFDARSHQALWHAYVDADVTGLTGAAAEQRIKAVVSAMFEKFPNPGAATPTPAAVKP